MLRMTLSDENIVFNTVDPTEYHGHTTRVGHSTFYRTVDSPIEEDSKANQSQHEEEDEVYVSQEEQKSLANPENNESGPRSPTKSQHNGNGNKIIISCCRI
jgi:hypothetical protein